MSKRIEDLWRFIRYAAAGGIWRDLAAVFVSWVRPVPLVFFADSELTEAVVVTTIEACRRQAVELRVYSVAPFGETDGVVKVSSRFLCYLARWLKADVFVTSSSAAPRRWMPKNARICIHVPHSLVSLHMIYPAGAFDGFDLVLGCGQHHVAEVNELARVRGLAGRRAEAVGYGKTDLLIRWRDEARKSGAGERERKRVLVAPSWGEGNLIAVMGEELIGGLLEAGFDVVLRPHPGILKFNGDVMDSLMRRFGGGARFSLELPSQPNASFFESELMISDYSGVGFEYAFVTENPVVWVEVPKKVLNPGYEEVGCPPVELAERASVGLVCEAAVGSVLEACATVSGDGWSAGDAGGCRERTHENFGRSGEAICARLVGLLEGGSN